MQDKNHSIAFLKNEKNIIIAIPCIHKYLLNTSSDIFATHESHFKRMNAEKKNRLISGSFMVHQYNTYLLKNTKYMFSLLTTFFPQKQQACIHTY
jgi:hypothetical protein